MQRYYVNDNAQSGGEHEVHVTGCRYLPIIVNKTPLGLHASCRSAVTAAKKVYANSDGCAHCCPACHTR